MMDMDFRHNRYEDESNIQHVEAFSAACLEEA
jgi:hypothetical protein